MKLRLIVSYDGRGYSGWQAQDNAKSIQRTLTDAVSEVYGRRCLVTGCSRTDAGVHALGYCCTAAFADTGGSGDRVEPRSDIVSAIPPENAVRALNARLPDSIAVLSASAAEDSFHPRYGVKSKTYKYVFRDGAVRSPFLSGLVYETRSLGEGEIRRMREAAEAMTGRRDFASFMASGSKITDTVRTVYSCTVGRRGEFVVFTVTADGFLYKMVRTMAGTALAVGRGRADPRDIEAIISARDRSRAFETLPPCGLYLCRVEY